MASCVIVGGGLSAWLASLRVNDATVLTPVSSKKIYSRSKENSLNKFFSDKTFDSQKIIISDKMISLKYRLLLGGASSVWGGFCDREQLSTDLLKIFNNHKIALKELSYKSTGSKANFGDIIQLQQHNQILNVGKLINVNNDCIVTSINGKTLNIIDTNNNVQQICANKIILAVDVLNLLIILFRSNMISASDVISVTEFDHKLRMSASSSGEKVNSITYNFDRAISHFLGIQHYKLKFLPVPFIVQDFLHEKRTLSFSFDGKKIQSRVKLDQVFGKSIHYCDLKINGVPIRDFLSEFDISVIGMPAITQNKPGPISQDIMMDVMENLI